MKKLLPADATSEPSWIWFQDEARVGQKGTLAYVWARCGTRPREVGDSRYGWAYPVGAVCPERTVGAFRSQIRIFAHRAAKVFSGATDRGINGALRPPGSELPAFVPCGPSTGQRDGNA